MRKFLSDEGFLEFDTGIIKSKYDGGDSKPFITHHNALNETFYLRVTTEMQLKQLLIAGYDRVFELGKSFRNEGIDHIHYPEFTLLELYSAYSTCNDVMNIVKNLILHIASTIKQENIVYNGNKIFLGDNWDIISSKDAFKKYANIDIDELRTSKDMIRNISSSMGYSGPQDLAKLIAKVIDVKIKPNLIRPTFLIDLPIELSPFAKPKAEDNMYAERAWLYIGGLDICDIYSDLLDREVVIERFKMQDKQEEKGKQTHMREEFVEALLYGMPPSAGVGMSVSRIEMLFNDVDNIRDIILFPHGT